jgi:hypothetical protein
LISLLISRYFLTTISGAWIFILNVSAGLGAVLILRWFWWRINAWSEISAMIAPIVLYPLSGNGINLEIELFSFVLPLNIKGLGLEPPLTLFPIVAGTTIVWITITYLTKPVSRKTLVSFYRKVHPGGIGWKRLSKEIKSDKPDTGFGKLFVNWLCGIGTIYAAMYGIGKILFSEYFYGFIALFAAFCLSFIIHLNLKND